MGLSSAEGMEAEHSMRPFHAGFSPGLLSGLLQSLVKFPSAPGSSLTASPVQCSAMELCQLRGLQLPGHDVASCSHRGTFEQGMVSRSILSQGEG